MHMSTVFTLFIVCASVAVKCEDLYGFVGRHHHHHTLPSKDADDGQQEQPSEDEETAPPLPPRDPELVNQAGAAYTPATDRQLKSKKQRSLPPIPPQNDYHKPLRRQGGVRRRRR